MANQTKILVGTTLGVLAVLALILAIRPIRIAVSPLFQSPEVNVNVPENDVTVGAAGSVFPTNWYVIGDVTHISQKASFGTSSSTPCNFSPPASPARLKSITVWNQTSTSTELTLRIASTTQPNATTTSLATKVIPAGYLAGLTYVPTDNMGYMATTTYYVVGIEGNGGVGSGDMKGVCIQEYQEMD